MTDSTEPAPRYTPCAHLWCITPYFNPAHYRTRRANYELFAAPIRAAGIPLLTVECAFGADPFELPPGPDILQVRCPHVLWQKERLLNLGVAHLSPQAAKVAWLDGDILFANPDWAVQTAALLDEFVVVQPFDRAIRLAEGERSATPQHVAHESFASIWQQDRSRVHAGGLDVHGHTGFAWAARRDLLANHGLYEAFVTSNGDHFHAHVFAGDLTSSCMRSVRQGSRLFGASRRTRGSRLHVWLQWLSSGRLRGTLHNLPGIRQPNSRFWTHFLAWAEPVAAAVDGRIGCAPGHLLHLWHGDLADRQSGIGRQLLHERGFDPACDIRIGPSGCIEWASDKPEIHQWLPEFFRRRREDGA